MKIKLFKPACPRILKGYKCHQDYPNGCEECGRNVKLDIKTA